MRTEVEFSDINLTEDSSLFLHAILFLWILKKTIPFYGKIRGYAQKSWVKMLLKNSISGHETWRGGKEFIGGILLYIPNFFLLLLIK